MWTFAGVSCCVRLTYLLPLAFAVVSNLLLPVSSAHANIPQIVADASGRDSPDSATDPRHSEGALVDDFWFLPALQNWFSEVVEKVNSPTDEADSSAATTARVASPSGAAASPASLAAVDAEASVLEVRNASSQAATSSRIASIGEEAASSATEESTVSNAFNLSAAINECKSRETAGNDSDLPRKRADCKSNHAGCLRTHAAAEEKGGSSFINDAATANDIGADAIGDADRSNPTARSFSASTSSASKGLPPPKAVLSLRSSSNSRPTREKIRFPAFRIDVPPWEPEALLYGATPKVNQENGISFSSTLSEPISDSLSSSLFAGAHTPYFANVLPGFAAGAAGASPRQQASSESNAAQYGQAQLQTPYAAAVFPLYDSRAPQLPDREEQSQLLQELQRQRHGLRVRHLLQRQALQRQLIEETLKLLHDLMKLREDQSQQMQQMVMMQRLQWAKHTIKQYQQRLQWKNEMLQQRQDLQRQHIQQRSMLQGQLYRLHMQLHSLRQELAERQLIEEQHLRQQELMIPSLNPNQCTSQPQAPTRAALPHAAETNLPTAHTGFSQKEQQHIASGAATVVGWRPDGPIEPTSKIDLVNLRERQRAAAEVPAPVEGGLNQATAAESEQSEYNTGIEQVVQDGHRARQAACGGAAAGEKHSRLKQSRNLTQAVPVSPYSSLKSQAAIALTDKLQSRAAESAEKSIQSWASLASIPAAEVMKPTSTRHRRLYAKRKSNTRTETLYDVSANLINVSKEKPLDKPNAVSSAQVQGAMPLQQPLPLFSTSAVDKQQQQQPVEMSQTRPKSLAFVPFTTQSEKRKGQGWRRWQQQTQKRMKQQKMSFTSERVQQQDARHVHKEKKSRWKATDNKSKLTLRDIADFVDLTRYGEDPAFDPEAYMNQVCHGYYRRTASYPVRQTDPAQQAPHLDLKVKDTDLEQTNTRYSSGRSRPKSPQNLRDSKAAIAVGSGIEEKKMLHKKRPDAFPFRLWKSENAKAPSAAVEGTEDTFFSEGYKKHSSYCVWKHYMMSIEEAMKFEPPSRVPPALWANADYVESTVKTRTAMRRSLAAARHRYVRKASARSGRSRTGKKLSDSSYQYPGGRAHAHVGGDAVPGDVRRSASKQGGNLLGRQPVATAAILQAQERQQELLQPPHRREMPQRPELAEHDRRITPRLPRYWAIPDETEEESYTVGDAFPNASIENADALTVYAPRASEAGLKHEYLALPKSAGLSSEDVEQSTETESLIQSAYHLLTSPALPFLWRLLRQVSAEVREQQQSRAIVNVGEALNTAIDKRNEPHTFELVVTIFFLPLICSSFIPSSELYQEGYDVVSDDLSTWPANPFFEFLVANPDRADIFLPKNIPHRLQVKVEPPSPPANGGKTSRQALYAAWHSLFMLISELSKLDFLWTWMRKNSIDDFIPFWRPLSVGVHKFILRKPVRYANQVWRFKNIDPVTYRVRCHAQDLFIYAGSRSAAKVAFAAATSSSSSGSEAAAEEACDPFELVKPPSKGPKRPFTDTIIEDPQQYGDSVSSWSFLTQTLFDGLRPPNGEEITTESKCSSLNLGADTTKNSTDPLTFEKSCASHKQSIHYYYRGRQLTIHPDRCGMDATYDYVHEAPFSVLLVPASLENQVEQMQYAKYQEILGYDTAEQQPFHMLMHDGVGIFGDLVHAVWLYGPTSHPKMWLVNRTMGPLEHEPLLSSLQTARMHRGYRMLFRTSYQPQMDRFINALFGRRGGSYHGASVLESESSPGPSRSVPEQEQYEADDQGLLNAAFWGRSTAKPFTVVFGGHSQGGVGAAVSALYFARRMQDYVNDSTIRIYVTTFGSPSWCNLEMYEELHAHGVLVHELAASADPVPPVLANDIVTGLTPHRNIVSLDAEELVNVKFDKPFFFDGSIWKNTAEHVSTKMKLLGLTLGVEALVVGPMDIRLAHSELYKACLSLMSGRHTQLRWGSSLAAPLAVQFSRMSSSVAEGMRANERGFQKMITKSYKEKNFFWQKWRLASAWSSIRKKKTTPPSEQKTKRGIEATESSSSIMEDEQPEPSSHVSSSALRPLRSIIEKMRISFS